VILAVGGGSTIDASKHIACAACYDGPAWNLMMDRTLIKRALPIAVVLTICATGSEMNSGGVITNESTQEKLEINSPLLYPRLSICDPTYLFTLPPKQTAAGSVDILSHAMEQYFQPNDEAYITDVLTEGVMKTVIKYAPIAMKIPDNYEGKCHTSKKYNLEDFKNIFNNINDAKLKNRFFEIIKNEEAYERGSNFFRINIINKLKQWFSIRDIEDEDTIEKHLKFLIKKINTLKKLF
jgi:hypothetical protein